MRLWKRREPVHVYVDSADAIERLPVDAARCALHVWLGGGLCRPVVVPTPQGVANRREARQLMTRVAVDQSGLAAPCHVEWDAGSGADSCLGVVIAMATADAIARVARARACRVVTIRPWWSHALHSLLADDKDISAIAVLEGAVLTMLAGEGAAVDASRTVDGVTDPDAARMTAQRWLVGLGADLRRSRQVRRMEGEGQEGKAWIAAAPDAWRSVDDGMTAT